MVAPCEAIIFPSRIVAYPPYSIFMPWYSSHIAHIYSVNTSIVLFNPFSFGAFVLVFLFAKTHSNVGQREPNISIQAQYNSERRTASVRRCSTSISRATLRLCVYAVFLSSIFPRARSVTGRNSSSSSGGHPSMHGYNPAFSSCLALQQNGPRLSPLRFVFGRCARSAREEHC